VPVEQIQRAGEYAEIGRKPVQPWQNVHRRGSDCRQGALLLAAGTRLSAPEVAIAAGAGMARLRVSAQPMIAVISTGNELVEPSTATRASPTITCATTRPSSPNASGSTCTPMTC
jgi:molybdopterin molybdotransferase